MKRKIFVLIPVIIVCLLFNWGIGPYSSGSAVRDLTDALKGIYGEPYTGREVENGTEDMEISVETQNYFLTDWNFRRFWGWDYHYECKVIYTTYSNGEAVSIKTITYDAIDPMNFEEQWERAYLIMESVKEETVQP